MYEIDKSKFGSFVAQLRREKGFTQKELAQKLFISDKAVSKWETGASIPDTALLVPLSELLGVSVTELLLCGRSEPDGHMASDEVESLVKTAISYAGTSPQRAYSVKSRWTLIYAMSLILCGVGLLIGRHWEASSHTVYTVSILSVIFGAYFCFLVQTRLPKYYDENRISGVYDSAFRMNVPGLSFNNSNWPHIITVGRVWACASMSAYPLLNGLMSHFMPVLWARAELYFCLVLVLGGLFVPIYIVGKKYESGPPV